ncbi:DUF4349 domain-containing protein [Candidatus Uhrbacteria bacterium]|nr:DUF4349 domain-containing protein [Candidatus Uhrbacteria bacterium]
MNMPRTPKGSLILLVGGIAAVMAIATLVGPDSSLKSLGSRSESSGAIGAPVPSMAPYPQAEDAYGNAAFQEKGVARDMIVPPFSPTAGETAAEVDQKIIKTGSLDLVVDDVSATASRVSALASGKSGFVQDSSVSEREDGTKFGNVTVRIPGNAFEETVDEIKSYAALVRSESSNGQDVTEQFTDLQAQLRNARAQEQVYLEILKKAETVSDVLAVQQQLGMIRGTIESLEGRIQYLENQTSYSTISVFLTEEPTLRIPTKEFRPSAILKEAFQALVAVFQNLAASAIWFVIVGGGILLPLGLLAWVVVRIVRRARNRTSPR